MRFSLPSREFIADSIEIMARGHAFDALVFIPNCDKCVPGMLMAMMRLNIPSVLVSGGPMLPGDIGPGKRGDLITVFEAVGKVRSGAMTEDELEYMTERACPGCGACAGMFTANSMNCLSETIGVALPGNGTIPAVSGARIRLAKKAGMHVMDLLHKNIRPLDIVTPKSVANAVAVDMDTPLKKALYFLDSQCPPCQLPLRFQHWRRRGERRAACKTRVPAQGRGGPGKRNRPAPAKADRPPQLARVR